VRSVCACYVRMRVSEWKRKSERERAFPSRVAWTLPKRHYGKPLQSTRCGSESEDGFWPSRVPWLFRDDSHRSSTWRSNDDAKLRDDVGTSVTRDAFSARAQMRVECALNTRATQPSNIVDRFRQRWTAYRRIQFEYSSVSLLKKKRTTMESFTLHEDNIASTRLGVGRLKHVKYEQGRHNEDNRNTIFMMSQKPRISASFLNRHWISNSSL